MSLLRWFSHPALRGAAGLLVAAGWYATQIEPRWLHVHRLTLALPRLPAEFDGYRIVHVSDHHLGVRGASTMLATMVQVVNREAPDLIALTGDLITKSRREHVQPEDAAPLADLRAPDGIWSVLGNHDYVDAGFVRELLTRNGIRLLRNQSHIVRRGAARIAIAGLDELHWGAPDLNATLATVPEDTPTVLLVHEPDFAPAAAAYPAIMLQLSGHTHGGQIMLIPGYPLVLPRYGHVYFRGLATIRQMKLYVTTGTGTGRFVARWNCRPEIAVITLRHPRTAQPVV